MQPDQGTSRDWVPPAQVDEFQLLRALGRGGMGHVYLGHDTVLERPVALKFIAGEPDLALRGRFLLEARAIARLSHPNVVAIYRIGDVLGRPYIAYEFVEGQSLDRLPRPLNWRRVLEVALGLSRGLAAAHRVGIVHRDIKPANVMLSAGGGIKLLDFGLAKFAIDTKDQRVRRKSTWPAPRDAAETARPARDRSIPDTVQLSSGRAAPDESGEALTEPGLVLGTPLYLAPEIWTGVPADPRSDLYSLGLVLHELCVGAPPRGTIPSGGRYHVPSLRDPAPLRDKVPDAPALFADVIDRCLRRDPSERFASGVELCAALEEAERLLRLVLRPSNTPPSSPITLVSASFARVEARSADFSERFYAAMFEARPELRPLFPGDMAEQRVKLMGALELAIEHLHRPDRLTPLLEELGRRHGLYGVKRSDFEVVGRCLLATLAEFDQEHWTESVAAGWEDAYAQISVAMQRGLVESSPSQRPVL